MKTLSSALEAHLASETTTLATCWKLTRRDTTVMGFTDHDKDIVIGEITYQAATGFTPTAISSSSKLAVDTLDVEGMLTADVIREDDVMAGLYDFAEIEIFKVNYSDLTQGVIKLRRGWLGEISLNKGQFVAEVRGLMQALSQHIGDLFSPSCRATLGDSRCKVNLEPYTETGTLTFVTSNAVFSDSTREEAAGFFTFGTISFTSGANEGLSMEIKEYVPGVFNLALPMPYAVESGDAYTVVAGCDKTFETCIARFTNAVNFRGEPNVPGTDRMLQTAGTRREWS